MRTLVPLSIYLPPEVLDEATTKANNMGIATATLLRLIVTGKQPPILLKEGGRKKG